MKKLLVLFMILVCSKNVAAQELVYLQCLVGAGDGSYAAIKGEERAFLINKTEKTISLIITGLSESGLKELSHSYSETDTQYASRDGFISINKYSLEFSISSLGSHASGKCVVKKPAI